jgi:phosphoribosylformylglycinamidine synthase
MKAKIYVKYKDGILDPQGKTAGHALKSMGIDGFEDMMIGKYIEMTFDNMDKAKAETVTDEACRKLLANPNTESYSFEIVESE